MLLHRFDREPGYNPGGLVDGLIATMHVKNDAELARALQIGQPILSKVRSRRAPVTAALLLRMHERSLLSVASLRKMMGVQAR